MACNLKQSAILMILYIVHQHAPSLYIHSKCACHTADYHNTIDTSSKYNSTHQLVLSSLK